jgi:DNA-binding NarL/FixJ family response regulator
VKRILIVDDSPLIRRLLRNLFETGGEWVVCGEAENGGEGIDKAQELQPDLIVMDLTMPGVNGIAATRMLKRLMPATPILMLTTFSNPYIKKEALAAGLDAFVDKTEVATTLVSSIQQIFLAKVQAA